MKHSTHKPTQEEQKRFEELKRLGCCACAQLGLWVVAPEIHHCIRGNRRLGHHWTIPLCPGHHRGKWSLAQLWCIPKEKRVAISDGRKRFSAIYGTERQLWEQVQRKLKLPLIWPSTKVGYEQQV